MATTNISVTVTTPAGVSVADVVGTLSAAWGYQATLPDGSANPQTAGQFVQARVARFLRESYLAAKSDQDAEAARQTSLAAAGAVTVA
jgi:hypothetical protein